MRLAVALAALALAVLPALTLAGRSELGDQRGLFELRHSAQHLPHQHGGRGIGEERLGAVGLVRRP